MLPRLEEIPRRRRSLNLTQKDLALLSGVSQSMIAKIEGSKIDPSYERTKKIFDALEELERKAEARAKEIASRKVVGVRRQDLVARATAVMRQTGFSQLPVLDKGFVVGSISEKSILTQVVKGKNLSELSGERVEEIMDEPFPQLEEDSPLSAIPMLLQYSPAVILTKRGRPSGIVTKADLLKVMRSRTESNVACVTARLSGKANSNGLLPNSSGYV